MKWIGFFCVLMMVTLFLGACNTMSQDKETDVVSDVESVIEKDIEGETKADPHMETEVRVETDPCAETETEVRVETDPYAETETDVRVETDPCAETETDVRVETDPYAETETDPSIETEPYVEIETVEAYDPFDYVWEVPPQPMSFETLNDAITFIETEDIHAYKPGWPEWQPALHYTIHKILKHGTITYVTVDSEEELVPDRVTIFPEVRAEDVGIRYEYEQDGYWIKIVVNYMKKNIDFEIDLEKHTYLDYRNARFDHSNIELIEHPDYQGYRSVYVQETDNFLRACMLLNEDQYLWVYINSSEKEFLDRELLIDIVEKLRFEEITISNKR